MQQGYRKRYETSFKALRSRSKVLTPNAELKDLKAVDWDELLASWGKSPADWNHLRRAVSTFLSVCLKDKFHPFRREVMALIPKAAEGPGRVPDLTPELFWRIVEHLPDHAKASVVVLVVTGMRVGEYLRTTKDDLRPEILGLLVPGTKTSGSRDLVRVDERAWPWIEAGIPSPLRYKWLRKYWKRACDAVGVSDLRLHDLRHCHGQWAVEGGVSEAAVQVSLRHASPDMTRRYTRQKNKGEVARAIGDALQLRAVS